MKISTILDHIDSGHMALPEFQRGYVWNRDQVRGFFDAMYKRHPVGSLLVWATTANTAAHRGDGPLASGTVKLLLDGQQRMTSLYGVIRGHEPRFFDGNASAFTGLRFHLPTETFEFYQPLKMQGDPLWVDVTDLMKQGTAGLGGFVTALSSQPAHAAMVGDYVGRLSRLLGVVDINLHIEEITGDDKTIDVVVNIFNNVNSGGTKLSKGDLALAKICADWPNARASMKEKLKEWERYGYKFNLDWVLRSLNTLVTGEAKFEFLHDQSAEDIQSGLKRVSKHIESSLNLIAGRLGLDHDRVFFGRYAIPVMVRYLDHKKGALNEKDRDKLLFWFAQSGMWGRFSGSTESVIDKDLAAIGEGGLDGLLEQLRLWHGGLRVEAGHFAGASLGARFYPVLYMLTRMGSAADWGTGLPLKANLLGARSKLEVHHIFPKSQLNKRKHKRGDVNAIANFCFLTKDTNFEILDRLPEAYFPEIEAKHPGVLASQWIPMDRELWKVDRYLDFLEARRFLLAEEANKRFTELLHGDDQWLQKTAAVVITPAGAVDDLDEERELEEVNAWASSQGLTAGQRALDYADPHTGEQLAIFDLAWPQGVQEELTQPVAILLNEDPRTVAIANGAGYRCFTSVKDFKDYISADILVQEAA